jgi:transcriptional regulator with XRE-family HTH domain
MTIESNDPDAAARAREGFIAELRHRREVAGVSQKALAKAVQYDPSYVSKVENATQRPSREFAEKADQHLKAGRALVRRWQALQSATPQPAGRERIPAQLDGDPSSDAVASLVVEHEVARLVFSDGCYHTLVRRQLRNVGTKPVTQYLIRIAVDRYPGDPERSNRLYRKHPLTWEEIKLAARCRGEPMAWRVKHDRDAFKELWLLFENDESRFALYPGGTIWIEYEYSVPGPKWGPWWQRAIRLPTRRLTLQVVLPTILDPVCGGRRRL